MFYLGLLLPICYLAGFTGTAILTQWVVLSVILPLALWRRGPFTFLHGLGLAFLVYSCASLLWVPNVNDSMLGLWHLLICALALWLGTTSPSLTQLWRGLALGLSISSFFAIGQVLGFETVYRNIGPVPGYSGLLFNSTVAGAAIALVVLALVTERLWLYIPALAPGLYLSHSRGGYLIIAVGLLARYVHWTVALLILVTCGLFAIYFVGLDSSNTLRLQIWSVAYAGLTNRGWGIGSFYDIWYQSNGILIHPEFVHNDYLQLAFEFGWGAIPVYIILGGMLYHTSARVWPVAVGFATCMAFYFPLSCPLIAFIGCIVTGHILREPYGLWFTRLSRGPWLLLEHPAWQSVNDPLQRKFVPVPSRTQNQE